MASIKIISGKNKPSGSAGLLALEAGEANYFEVPDWMPQSANNPGGGYTPPRPSEIEKPKQITWTLKDKEQKQEFFTVTSNVLEKASLSINKKYSGSYSYYLEASLNGTSEKANVFIKGVCDPNITAAKWSKEEGTTNQSELNYGNDVFVELETEGLNGDMLTLEVYSKKDNKTVRTTKKECVNGKLQAKFTTQPFLAALSKPQETEEFYIKVKSLAGAYVKGASNKEEVLSFSIKNKTVSPEVEKPANNAALKVGKPDKEIISVGFISLEKIAVTTKYDVCSDEVEDFSDFKNFWILENKGKYYHWLKKSLIGVKEADDKNKPAEIPITLASTEKFAFKATFKTIFPIDGLQVRVRDKEGKYTFQVQPHPKKNKDEEHVLTFISDNTPYKDTLQHFPNFELIFDFSLDGKSWTPMGSARFCFYLTWKEPEYATFESLSAQTETMQIKCNPNAKKANILETLLWLGCSMGSGKGNLSKKMEENEEQVLTAIFKQFETKKVVRRREGGYVTKNWVAEGMGYWRGISAVGINPITDRTDPKAYMFYDATTGQHIERTSKVILKYGEFRCGEWTSFLTYIGLTQGIPLKQFAIFSGIGYDPGIDSKKNKFFVNTIFLVKGWTINDPLPPTLPPSTTYRAQGNASPLHYFSDHVFTLFERGGNKKYYDASYGMKFKVGHTTDKQLLSEYSTSALDGVVYIREKVPGKAEYKTISTQLEKHLVIKIYTGLNRLHDSVDDKITYTI